MAPTPVDDNAPPEQPTVANPTSTATPKAKYWTNSVIATTTVFALLALVIFVVLLVFFLRRRTDKKKRQNRKSDHAALLDNEDKTSMFSRERHSSVTLYLDNHDNDTSYKRASQESASLIPLQVTPLNEVHDPMNHTNNNRVYSNVDTTTASNGSGVSSISRLSNNTASTMMLSPITSNGEDGDLGTRPSGRPRSTSTASQKMRYYDSTPTNVEMPPVPKIVRTPSD